ncbi:hypothetical protein SCLCIDRAFT_1209033 [Scleroderma citrinum Foug A]|uniref:Metal homeostatis protein bsd2 n=1 Tax=Scleroderma citrinum Foug A TaxID=1036808 RepID=A0A0C3ELN5_9AGAM|nr:hypothetical protein SCLCIDRAFT_1209033 [Scleroderma citrinum Foug A]
MVVRYAPIPNPRTEPDTNPELNAAFDGSDDEGADESQPLNSDQPSPCPTGHLHEHQVLTYDFDSPIPDYDHPPPGSPPPPTVYALPNTIGNTNGNIPVSTPNNVPRPPTKWWKRTASAVLPSYYVSRFGLDAQSSSSGTRGHVLGGGLGNDGVFRNMAAKPSTAGIRVQDGDSIYVVPEESSATSPPSYAAAQADAVPPYHTSTLLLPSNGGPLTQGSVIVEALPTGTLFVFLWNALVSTTFQFIGFVLTWVMSTTHAARFGSRAGLGVTLIQWGLGLRARLDEAGSWGRPTFATAKEADEYYQSIGLFNSSASELPPTPTQSTAPDGSQMDDTWPGDSVLTSPMATEWLSFLFMTAGWFLLLTSGLGFWRVKRWEKSILAPSAPTSDPPPPATEDHTRSLSEIDADTEMSWESFLAPLIERARYHRLPQQDEGHVSADPGGEQQEGPAVETIRRVRTMREELRSMGVL